MVLNFQVRYMGILRRTRSIASAEYISKRHNKTAAGRHLEWNKCFNPFARARFGSVRGVQRSYCIARRIVYPSKLLHTPRTFYYNSTSIVCLRSFRDSAAASRCAPTAICGRTREKE